jgi:Tfp pilus assembly protein PilF
MAATADLARSAYEQGRYEESERLYAEALAEDPTSVALLRGLALAHIHTGRYSEACDVAGRAAYAQPANPDTRYVYGYALLFAQRFSESIRELDAALALKPNHPEAREALLGALSGYGDAVKSTEPASAEIAMHRAIGLDPRNVRRQHAYYELLFQTGQMEKAIREAATLDPSVREVQPLKALLDTHLGVSATVPASNISTPIIPTPSIPTQHNPVPSALSQAAFPTSAPGAIPAPAGTQIANPGAFRAVMPCPNCRQSMAAHASVCPHCRYTIGSPLNQRPALPTHDWQDIALNICLSLYILLAAVELLLWGLASFAPGPLAFNGFFAVVRIAVAGGVLARQDWAGTIFKYVLWLNLTGGVCLCGAGVLSGTWPLVAVAGLTIAVLGFLLYLLHFAMDV